MNLSHYFGLLSALHMVQYALLAFHYFVVCERLDVVDRWVACDSGLDLKKLVLFRLFTLSSLKFVQNCGFLCTSSLAHIVFGSDALLVEELWR